jgi:copper chaperone CopZ
MSPTVHRRPPIFIIALVMLAIPPLACGAAARQQARTTAPPPVLASPILAVSGHATDGGGANNLIVETAGNTLTFSSAAYCKACSASVAQEVATLPGVQRADADPNAATFRIMVQYDPAQADTEQITGEVRKELVAYDLNKVVLHRTEEGVELSSGRFT